jgi:23S rRNA pseudouridine2605 synthase
VKERIQKILGNAGVASRRKIEEMILQGRVAVNGRVLTELPILVDPDRDRVTVDDEPVKIDTRDVGRRLYFLMNKPKGVYSTNVAQGAQLRAVDLLPPDLPGRVYPVGRLDAESTGLLLLTNDGELTNHLTHPRYGVTKTYRAIVSGRVNEQSLRELEQGVWLADKQGRGFKTGRVRIKVTKTLRGKGGDKSVLEISLREGRNRQVRRMLAKIGNKVRELTRVKLGPLTLHGLGPGQFRELTSREIRELRSMKDREPVTRKSESKEYTSRTERPRVPGVNVQKHRKSDSPPPVTSAGAYSRPQGPRTAKKGRRH